MADLLQRLLSQCDTEECLKCNIMKPSACSYFFGVFARSIDAVLRWVETTGAPNSKTPTARSCCQLLECCRHGEAALRLLRLLLRCQRGGFGCLGDLADSGAQEEHHGCSSPAPLVFECLHWGSADERAPLQNEGEARCTFSDNLKLLVQNTLKLVGLVLGCWTKTDHHVSQHGRLRWRQELLKLHPGLLAATRTVAAFCRRVR